MEKVLLFFSGGKDSFITACRLAEADKHVILISFNNGSVAHETNILHGVERLQKHYGKEHITYAGVYCTAATIQRFMMQYANMPFSELCVKYPNVRFTQFQCWNCQTSMWVAGIAYAVAKGIRKICTGYRQSDLFCTGSSQYMTYIRNIASEYNIALNFPVWQTDWDSDEIERDYEMARHSFNPAVLEPKCMLGLPTTKMSVDEESNLIEYTTEMLNSIAHDMIESLIPIFKCMELRTTSFM